MRSLWKWVGRGFVALALAGMVAGAVAADNELTPQEKKGGWILLFDGKSMNDWMTSDWVTCDQALDEGSINPEKCDKITNAGYIIYEREWADFVLALDFKIGPRTNSGIILRASPLKAIPEWPAGASSVEVQILDSQTADYHDTGAFYDLVKPTRNAMKPAGEWNHVEITCNRNIIAVKLNGEDVTRMDLDQWTEPNKRPDGTPHKFPEAFRNHPRKGYIGLQDHGADCWFKNIKLKPLA